MCRSWIFSEIAKGSMHLLTGSDNQIRELHNAARREDLMSNSWFERLVGEWVAACKQMGWTKEEVERARSFIDGEYGNEFQYPSHYLALRAFFLHCAILGPDEAAEGEEEELWASPAWRAIAGTERAYRMGWADAIASQSIQETASDAAQ
jgi:hypothetical protein